MHSRTCCAADCHAVDLELQRGDPDWGCRAAWGRNVHSDGMSKTCKCSVESSVSTGRRTRGRIRRHWPAIPSKSSRFAVSLVPGTRNSLLGQTGEVERHGNKGDVQGDKTESKTRRLPSERRDEFAHECAQEHISNEKETSTRYHFP